MLPCGGDGSGVAPPAAGGDGIDALPDEVLHHILGFLEAYEAVRTCVLAKRWRHLWRHTTSLRVVANEGAFLGSVEKTLEFLDHLLPLREGSPLQTCELRFDDLDRCLGALLDDDGLRGVNNWFWHAIMHKVRNLSLYGPFDDNYWLELYDMPLNSQHLTRLEFAGVEVFSSRFLNFSNCPALEYLQFQRCNLFYNISSKSLKRLIITECYLSDTDFDSRIHISAPNLVSLCISDFWGTPVLESMPSLVGAFIDSSGDAECQKVCHCEFCDNTYVIGDSIGSNSGVLLSGLSEAKNLTFKSYYPKWHIFKRDLRWCPMFSKLKTLVLDENWCVPDEFRALVCLLEHSPVLEKLTLEFYYSKKPRSEMIIKGDFRPMEGSAAILEHLKLVEVRCITVDERIAKLLMFLCAFHIRFSYYSDPDSE